MTIQGQNVWVFVNIKPKYIHYVLHKKACRSKIPFKYSSWYLMIPLNIPAKISAWKIIIDEMPSR